jgi:probable FeS assembly SUF system protein SufT
MVGLERKQAEVNRDVEVIQIPSGDLMTIFKGTNVTITQTLGGNFTVITDQGFMVRINAKDGDAIGEKAQEAIKVDENSLTKDNVEKNIWQQLQSIYDPEIPVSIVELGLIYKMEVAESKPHEFHVNIDMTLTAPGCGMGQVLRNDVEEKIKAVPGVRDYKIEVVLDPPWDREMMTEAAKLQLGLF